MREPFYVMLGEDGHKNSLGRVDEVIQAVLDDTSRIEELYRCICHEDAWVRMRAMDGFEKVCRLHPEWIEPYIDAIQAELASSTQASILWHIAEIYQQVRLSTSQRADAIAWLEKMLSTSDIDWIVAAKCMDTLVLFVRSGYISQATAMPLVKIQQQHTSKAVRRRADKSLALLI